MSCLSSRLGGVLLFLLWMQAAWAADVGTSTEPTGELSLARAIAAALQRNPELAVSSYELAAAEGRVTQAGVRPNPEVAAQFDNLLGTGAASGVKVLETSLTLSQVIELGGKRASRVQVAERQRNIAGIERQARQLDVLADVTRRFIDVVANQAALRVAQRATALAEQTLAAIAARVQAARSPLAEQSRASIAVTRARIEQRSLESALQSASRSLSALWGGRGVSFTNASADLFALPEVSTFEVLSAKLQANPDFLRFASEARLHEAEVRLAQANAKSDLNVGVGVRRFEATGNAALLAGFSMTIPVFNRNQGTIREAQARREQSGAQSQAALIRAEATLYGLYQQLQASRARVEALRGDALPQAEAALAQTRNGYQRGRFSYLELASAQQELLGLEAAAVDAAADYHRQLAEIERLTAEPLAN